MERKKISLDREKETLLVPLYGKAIENRKRSPLLKDKKALEIIDQIVYDFSSLKIPGKTNTMMCLRAKLIDNFVSRFMSENTNSLVLHLGCGLDSRYHRVGNTNTDWYDIDFMEVIDIRKHFYSESETYHMIGSSVTEPRWLEMIPANRKNTLVVAEGLFMYLKEEEIKTLLERIRDRLGRFTLIFDAFSRLTARQVKNHPSIKRTGATISWGIDDPDELCRWDEGIRFMKEIVFTSNEEIDKMGWGTRWVYKLADLFPVARRAQRILIYFSGSNA